MAEKGLKRYVLEHEPLPEMELVKRKAGKNEVTVISISGEVDERMAEIDAYISLLESFRKECWRFIDREKNRKVVEPFVKEIDRLKAKCGEE